MARSWPVGKIGGVIEITGVEVAEGSGVTLGVDVAVGVGVAEGDALEVGKRVLLGLGVKDGGRDGGASSEATTLVGEPFALGGISGSGVCEAKLSTVLVGITVLSTARVCDSLNTCVATTF